MTNYTIKVLQNNLGMSKTPVFEFQGKLEKFNMAAFERKLKSIQKHVEGRKYILWCLFSFSYGFVLRAIL